MFWVVQNNLYSERGYHALLGTLKERGIPHAVTVVSPLLHRLLPEGFDSHAFRGDLSEAPEIEVDDRDGVMAMGSVTLGEAVQARGWKPGTFLNEHFDWRHWAMRYGEDALNAGGRLVPFAEADFSGQAFVRPALDDKSFNGRVMGRGAFLRWQADVLERPDALAPIQPDTLVVIAPKRQILAEYRAFVVDGEVVTSSRYRLHGRLSPEAGMPDGAESLVERMVAAWQPARAFVLDTALVVDPDGRERYRVMEPGCINSAGFYAADTARIVDAVEAMRFDPVPGAGGPGRGHR